MKPRLVIVVLLVTGFVVLLALHMERDSGDSDFDFDISEIERIEPHSIVCSETATYPVKLQRPGAIAVRPDGTILVGGDTELLVLTTDGEEIERVDISAKPMCIAVGKQVVYVGTDKGVTVLDEEEKSVVSLSLPHSDSWLTSAAVTRNGVYFADFGLKTVWRYTEGGKAVRGIVCRADGEAGDFNIPSPYFDIATGLDDSIWVAHTGKHRLENYRVNGEFLGSWGRSSVTPAGFAGCCNPSHFAVRSDGSFVTCEKGLVRVKLYSPTGEFVGFVAGPEAFRKNAVGLDVAVDSEDRILVLDPDAKSVRVFQLKSTCPSLRGTESGREI